MIVRRIMYMSKTGKDVMKWIKANSQVLRVVDGMREVEFIRSKETPKFRASSCIFTNLKTWKNIGTRFHI